MNPPHEQAIRGWNADSWRAASLAAAWATGGVAIAAAGLRWGLGWDAIAGLLAVLGAAIGAGGALRILIHDALVGLTYRERFALFLGHLMLLFMPIFVAGKSWFPVGLALVLASLGLLLFQPVTFHRYLAVSAALLLTALWGRPPGTAGFALGWAACAGVLLVAERVRFLLERADVESMTVSPRQAAAMVALYVVGPVALAGLIAWLIPPNPRSPYAPPPAGPALARPPAAPIAGPDLESTIYQALWLAASIAVAIAILNWLASRRSAKVAAPPRDEGGYSPAATETSEPAAEPASLDPLDGGTPRERILRAFRGLERALRKFDLGRRSPWTAREYGGHLRRSLGVSGPDSTPSARQSLARFVDIHEKARYTTAAPSPEEAADFQQAADEILRTAKSRARAASPEEGE